MEDVEYEFRPALGKPVSSFTLAAETLTYSGSTLTLPDVAAIRAFALPGIHFLAYGPVAPPARRCIVSGKDGRKIELCSLHFAGIGRPEDRTGSYTPFIRALIVRTRACNPTVPVYWGVAPALWWFLLAIFGTLLLTLAAIIVLGTAGLIAKGQFNWAAFGFMLALAVIAIGPTMYVRALWLLRSRPLELDDI